MHIKNGGGLMPKALKRIEPGHNNLKSVMSKTQKLNYLRAIYQGQYSFVDFKDLGTLVMVSTNLKLNALSIFDSIFSLLSKAPIGNQLIKIDFQTQFNAFLLFRQNKK
ncbi:hypothetical protein [Marinifilum caeruleilacunae]|uniref:Uncharacterized protein n=1 Tax=Marinifilum caeruleilacunae TaxID=2499076 RepID=A0ABX1WTW0_9BACT|nr:hypothetical protein [Marinifilum caeruleilacunae]NOU59544.1 hypothetical protein [Marinifilum caeruleilacunae]